MEYKKNSSNQPRPQRVSSYNTRKITLVRCCLVPYKTYSFAPRPGFEGKMPWELKILRSKEKNNIQTKSMWGL